MILTSLGEIGHGGFGTVDLVRNVAGHQFARKSFTINQPLQQSLRENVLRRFRKEVRTQSGISNRNIVPIIYSDLDATPPFYLMPVAVSVLDKDISKDKTLGGNFIAALSDIVAGLEALHAIHIYHRDLKPQNVLCFKDQAQGQDYYAISDFGLISLQESQLSVLTTTGMGRGADYYTAPEITQDLRHASVQSDIYSLGCILHDFVGLSPRIPCSEIHESSQFGAILSGCTRKDPGLRFKSARAVLDAVLSVGSVGHVPTSAKAADFVADLERDPRTVPPERWRELADFLYDMATVEETRAICMRLNEDCITVVCHAVPSDAKTIGLSFARWVAQSDFNFEYCDGLANRLEIFFSELNDYELQAVCLMALLAMGTSHNRWYVEHKFIRLAGPGMEINLANRLSIELRILDRPACAQIGHLEASIRVGREALHPLIQKTLSEVCK